MERHQPSTRSKSNVIRSIAVIGYHIKCMHNALTVPGGTVLHNEVHIAETEEGSVETEEGSVEAEEATFSAVYNHLLAADGSSEHYPTGYNKEQEIGVRR